MCKHIGQYPDPQTTDFDWLSQIPAHWEFERAKCLFMQTTRPESCPLHTPDVIKVDFKALLAEADGWLDRIVIGGSR